MANKNHLNIISRGTSAWNEWREANPDQKPNLSGIDLSGGDYRNINLSDSDLANTIFTLSKLNNANFENANLYQAEFYKADLSNANLSRSDLRGAKFHAANLTGADLSESILYRVDFIETRLHKTLLVNSFCNTTAFSNLDLSKTLGLLKIQHQGPSSIDILTLVKSGNSLPKEFLLNCGVPEIFVDYLPSLINSLTPFSQINIFISFDSQDLQFVEWLYRQLRSDHISVWYAPNKIGLKNRDFIDAPIFTYDKLFLILSKNSLNKNWLATAIRDALENELKEGKRKLFFIGLVDSKKILSWKCYDADTGKNLADIAKEYSIIDFSTWQNGKVSRIAYEKLLNDVEKLETIPHEERSFKRPESSILQNLRFVLSNRFNESELRNLCFDLKIDYEKLSGSNKSDKAREIVLFFERRNDLARLIDYILNHRNDISKEDIFQ